MQNNHLYHSKLIQTFYESFQKKDVMAMQNCYDDAIVFSDEVFKNLKGLEAKAMWDMLVRNGKDLSITFKNNTASETEGSALWIAEYTFSRTGRKVRNSIHADFKFSNGKITAHTDHFNFYKWNKMAFGFIGFLFGWTKAFQQKIRSTAAQALKKFIAENSQYQENDSQA